MKVFISWSGDTSRQVASAFADWLPLVIQSLRPFISLDIASGQRWEEEIGSQLNTTAYGLICLTPDNLTKPWLLFEAGALSKGIEDSAARVVPLCHGLATTDIGPPLGHFQARTTERPEIYRLMKDINATTPEPLPMPVLDVAFEAHWDRLATQLAAISTVAKPASKATAKPSRTAEDMLAEILSSIRDLTQVTVRSAALPYDDRYDLRAKGPDWEKAELRAVRERAGFLLVQHALDAKMFIGPNGDIRVNFSEGQASTEAFRADLQILADASGVHIIVSDPTLTGRLHLRPKG